MLLTNADKYQINMELIADQAALYFLKKSDYEGESFKEIKRLFERKISGDNPSREEWRKNAIANVKAKEKAYSYPYACSYSYPYSYAYSYAYYDKPNPYNYYFAFDSTSSTKSNDVEDYIISLLNGYIEPIDQLNSKVLKVWNKGTTTNCREHLEIALHPKGKELEKHFGTLMAATLIHTISTGERVDYSASKDEVMADLKLTSEKGEQKC